MGRRDPAAARPAAVLRRPDLLTGAVDPQFDYFDSV